MGRECESVEEDDEGVWQVLDPCPLHRVHHGDVGVWVWLCVELIASCTVVPGGLTQQQRGPCWVSAVRRQWCVGGCGGRGKRETKGENPI